MPKIAYIDRRFTPESRERIAQADAICQEYAAMGFTLTLRQLYYQHVARGFIPNNERSYKNLGSLLNDARLAGLIDWSHMEDRTRNLQKMPHWESPEDVIRAAASGYRINRWENQQYYVEVWIEKDALVGVIEQACVRNDVPYFSCRGYTSQSELWAAAMRLVPHIRENRDVRIIHLGDHDPSGIDMTRDITDRLRLFLDLHIPSGNLDYLDVERIALNWRQVQEFNPPPNPTKLTDSRASGYVENFGYESWELDALDPTTIDGLIEGTIRQYVDEDQWAEDIDREKYQRSLLTLAADNWHGIANDLEGRAS